MEPENVSAPTSPARKRNSRKVRAILAGGLIAGVGIVSTLATWNSGIVGRTNIAGSDSSPSGDGLLEVFNADGNWVSSNEAGQVHLLTALALPSKDVHYDRLLTHQNVGKVRVTGIDSNDEFKLVGSVAPDSDRQEVKEAVAGGLYLTPGECTPANDFPKYYFTRGDNGLVVKFLEMTEREHSMTGPVELNVCLNVKVSPSSVPDFGADDSVYLDFALTASPDA